jgi:alpha-galactosidase
MGIRLNQIPEKPVFIYNTWEPFRHDINEKLIYELADAAAECGIEEFIIDDGWQDNYGDWGINKEKFPNGLKPVFDYIKSKGMKPGLWISIGAAESKSNVYRDHPEWLVRKADGSPISLHADFDRMYDWESYSMCMTTGWYDHIKGVILNLVKEHGLEYIKGDFAVVTGAYTTDKTRSGCHAKDHPLHKDRNESMLEMYQRTWQLFDDLHREAPNLFIDCTFETMGALQLIDLDMCKHAEGNWLSNFYEKAPDGSLRVRNMSWWRSPVIPATAMVIGNQHFDDPQFELSLMSLNGSLPIVLGDPRKLKEDEKARMKSWADWMRKAQEKHDYMAFRQDLQGYGEPAEGCWDGFQRINTDTGSGGIVGIFRQGSHENERVVTVKYLDPSAVYEVKKAPSGEAILRSTGNQLEENGFKVSFKNAYDGSVYEIVKLK